MNPTHPYCHTLGRETAHWYHRTRGDKGWPLCHATFICPNSCTWTHQEGYSQLLLYMYCAYVRGNNCPHQQVLIVCIHNSVTGYQQCGTHSKNWSNRSPSASAWCVATLNVKWIQDFHVSFIMHSNLYLSKCAKFSLGTLFTTNQWVSQVTGEIAPKRLKITVEVSIGGYHG